MICDASSKPQLNRTVRYTYLLSILTNAAVPPDLGFNAC
jgi:hypothetical protein